MLSTHRSTQRISVLWLITHNSCLPAQKRACDLVAARDCTHFVCWAQKLSEEAELDALIKAQKRDQRRLTPGRSLAHPLSLDAPIEQSELTLADCIDENGHIGYSQRTSQQEIVKQLDAVTRAVEELRQSELPCHGCGKIIPQGGAAIAFSTNCNGELRLKSLLCPECEAGQVPPTQPPPDWERCLTDDQQRVWDLHKQGYSQRGIAAEMGWNQMKACRTLKKIERIRRAADAAK